MSRWDRPNFADVRWDHRASGEAIAALRRAADMLERTADETTRLAVASAAEWAGTHRATFDTDRRRLDAETRNLAVACRAAAGQVAAASQRAREEQDRREREREAWERRERERRENSAQPRL